MTRTHYVVAFTSAKQKLRMAACGRFVEMAEHSVEPDCPKCAAWLEADSKGVAELAKQWEQEETDKRLAAMKGTR